MMSNTFLLEPQWQSRSVSTLFPEFSYPPLEVQAGGITLWHVYVRLMEWTKRHFSKGRCHKSTTSFFLHLVCNPRLPILETLSPSKIWSASPPDPQLCSWYSSSIWSPNLVAGGNKVLTQCGFLIHCSHVAQFKHCFRCIWKAAQVKKSREW